MSNTSSDSPDFDPNANESPSPETAPPSPSAEVPSDRGSAADRFRESVQSRQGEDDEREGDIWEGRYSSKAMIGKWIMAAVITIAMLVGVVMWDFRNGTLWLIWLSVTVVMWCGLWCFLKYRQWGCKYLLTTQRLIHEKGILKRITDRIEVIDIDDVTLEQGVIERLVGVGSIKVTSSDRSDPELWIVGIEGAKQVAGTIDDVRRKERRRRGLHIEAI
jgi:membrane protein YdbS with pleckstrin-like domain